MSADELSELSPQLLSRPARTSPGRVKAFDRWFAGSRVVNCRGGPLVVYHGTGDDFSIFRERGSGIWFSADPLVASAHAQSRGQKVHSGPNIVPVYLSMQRPLIVEAKGSVFHRIPLKTSGIPEDVMRHDTATVASDEVAGVARHSGYDGAIFRDLIDGPNGESHTVPSDVFVVFKSDQIKSAIGVVLQLSTRAQARECVRAPSTRRPTPRANNGQAQLP